MIHAVTYERGLKMLSFLGSMAWAVAVLIPSS